jgi:hypothetical protein
MGIKPEVILAPSVLAEFEQRAARFKAVLDSSGLNKLIEETKVKLEQVQKLVKPYTQSLIAAGERLKQQVSKAFNETKTWVKKFFVKYFPIVLQLVEILRAQIQPSSGKALQLPNSFRSHSPPLCSVIV